MGALLPVYQVLCPHQIIVLEDGRSDHKPQLPAVTHLNRQDALWKQLGWVATDEMAFYLQMIGQPNLTHTTPPLILTNTETDVTVIEEWIAKGIDQKTCEDTEVIMHTACLLNNHWFPLSARFAQDLIHLTTTLPDLPKVQQLATAAFGEVFQFHYKVPVGHFPADCGFQTIAWIMTQELHESHTTPMTTVEAIKWRALFAQHLINQNRALCVDFQVQFGGMTDQTLADLSALLQQHGVKSERVTSLVNHLVQTLGIVTIKSAMGSARPWADLKARASAHQPPIKLVLAEELQMQIADRLRTGKPMGNRKNKQPHKTSKSQWVAPMATQVQIPDAIFQQQDGTPLKQISLHQLQLNQRGVAVVNIQDAAPFFNLQKPLCTEGVGMLVLEFQDSSLPANHQIIRFPASCPETQEPMILTAALLQLGQQQVTRVLPSDPTMVDQVETSVIRAVLYKDECTLQWSPMSTKPVKALLDLDHFSSLDKGDLLDVWDRQHLNKQYQKMKPQESFGSGDRYGPRTSVEDAPTVHGQHRPEVAHLDGAFAKTFKIAPLPFGSTRQSSQKVFDTWGWNARPSHTQGLTPDREGLVWIAHATEQPSFYIFTMQHGDVLISEMPTQKPMSVSQEGVPVASTRTLRHLSATAAALSSQNGDQTKQDPLQLNDPWAGAYRSQTSKPSAITPSQMAMMENNVEKRLRATFQESMQPKQADDATMDGQVDLRVSSLEHQVSSLTENLTLLTNSVSSFKQQQLTHNTQVAHQVQALKSQADQQELSMKSLLEQKMEEQMSRIEALLTNKRSKTAAE
eukprot:s730_g11.t1